MQEPGLGRVFCVWDAGLWGGGRWVVDAALRADSDAQMAATRQILGVRRSVPRAQILVRCLKAAAKIKGLT